MIITPDENKKSEKIEKEEPFFDDFGDFLRHEYGYDDEKSGDWYWDGEYDDYDDALVAHNRLGFNVCR